MEPVSGPQPTFHLVQCVFLQFEVLLQFRKAIHSCYLMDCPWIPSRGSFARRPRLSNFCLEDRHLGTESVGNDSEDHAAPASNTGKATARSCSPYCANPPAAPPARLPPHDCCCFCSCYDCYFYKKTTQLLPPLPQLPSLPSPPRARPPSLPV